MAIIDAPSMYDGAFENQNISGFSMRAVEFASKIADDTSNDYVFYLHDKIEYPQGMLQPREIYYYTMITGTLDDDTPNLYHNATLYSFDTTGTYSVTTYDDDDILVEDISSFCYTSVLDDTYPALVDNVTEGVVQYATLYAICVFFVVFVLERFFACARVKS